MNMQAENTFPFENTYTLLTVQSHINDQNKQEIFRFSKIHNFYTEGPIFTCLTILEGSECQLSEKN